MSLVTQSFEHRLKTGYVRNDFIQLLLQLREKGSVEFENHDNDEEDKQLMDTKLHTESHKEVYGTYVKATYRSSIFNRIVHKMTVINVCTEITDGVLAAQLFVFLVAGFETTSTTIYHLTYLLSLNQDAQDKAREEVRKALAKSGDYTYSMVKDLKYLSNCINGKISFHITSPYWFITLINY